MNWNYDLSFDCRFGYCARPLDPPLYLSVYWFWLCILIYTITMSQSFLSSGGEIHGISISSLSFFLKQCACKKWPNKHRANISFWQNPPVCDLNGSDIIESARINIIWWRVAVEKWYRSKSGLTSCV